MNASHKSNNVPTVSVIIPTYNRANLIGRSIQSVLGQTYRDFEVIIIDDNSTDNTGEVVRSFRDPRIIYIKLSSNSGVSAARNQGIQMAKGTYIAFQDSDDEWFPHKWHALPGHRCRCLGRPAYQSRHRSSRWYSRTRLRLPVLI